MLHFLQHNATLPDSVGSRLHFEKKNKVKIFLKSSYFLMIYLFSLKIRRLKNKKVDFFEVDFEKTQSTPNTTSRIQKFKKTKFKSKLLRFISLIAEQIELLLYFAFKTRFLSLQL